MPQVSKSPRDPELLSLREVAERPEVHDTTADWYVRLGMLPATHEGRSWVIRAADLAEFSEAPPSATERGDAPWNERLLSRMLDADASGAWAVTEAAHIAGYGRSIAGGDGTEISRARRF